MSGGGRDGLQLPPGFRFHPTDEELVTHYLLNKCAARPIAVPIIAEVDLYRQNPWDLPELALYGEKEWYFFSPRDRKYPNGSRPNRAAGSGYWKATGADKPIGTPKPLAIKKALVFYAGKAPKGEKTNWIMHEYRLADVDRSANGRKKNSLRLDDWVLCRIYNKKGCAEKHVSLDRKSSSSAAAAATGKGGGPAELTSIAPTPPPQMRMMQLKQEAFGTDQHQHQHPQQQVLSDFVYFADSSCSEHVFSSAENNIPNTTNTTDSREVQSQPAKWKPTPAPAPTPPHEWERLVATTGLDAAALTVGPMPPPLPFPPQLDTSATHMPTMFRDPMLQDIFMYLQKPF